MKPKISKHKIEEFLNVIPASEIEHILGKRETKQFWKFMEGQTITPFGYGDTFGIYRGDLERFLKRDWDLYD